MINALLLWMGSLVLVTSFIRKLTKDADKDLEPVVRDNIALVLLEARQSGFPIKWVPNFTLVFDSFFGDKHFHRKCFLRSAAISIVLYILLVLVVTGLSIPVFNDFAKWKTILALIFLAVIINVPMDYLSLYQTRILINFRLPIYIKLILDLVLTSIIAVVWVTTTIYLFTGGEKAYYSEIWHTLLAFWHLFFYPTPENNYRTVSLTIFIPVATCYSTSIWLWLHGLSESVIRLCSSIKPIVNWLNVVENPIRSIGVVINILICGLWVILLPFSVIT